MSNDTDNRQIKSLSMKAPRAGLANWQVKHNNQHIKSTPPPEKSLGPFMPEVPARSSATEVKGATIEAVSNTFAVSGFLAPVSNITRQRLVGWEEFCRTLQEDVVVLPDNKPKTKANHGQYFVRGKITGERKDENLSDCCLLILDIDKPLPGEELPTVYDIHDTLKDIIHAIYTSVTPGRSRVVVPVEPYRKEKTDTLTRQLYDFCMESGLRFAYAGESSTKSQPWFYGQTLDRSTFVCLVNDDGLLFNPDPGLVIEADRQVYTGIVDTEQKIGRNHLSDFIAELKSGTIHQAAKSYAGWQKRTTMLTMRQIFDDITVLIEAHCSDQDKVQRWHESERAGLEAWFKVNVDDCRSEPNPQISTAIIEINLEDEPEEIQRLRDALDAIPANAVFERHVAESIIGWGLRHNHSGIKPEVGATLCSRWDRMTGGRSLNIFTTCDPAYNLTSPITVGSIFALAKANGWTGQTPWTKPADGLGLGFESWEPNTPEWPTLGKKAYRGLAADFVALAARNSEADPAAILVTFLVRFGVEVGPDVYMNVGDTRHKARLAAVIVGASSKARKGTSGRPVTKLFDFADTFYADGEPYRSARFSKGPFSSGEGIIFAVRDAATKWNIKEQTEEVADPGVEDKRLFVLDEEFGGVLANTKREGNILSMVIRSAWDSGNFDPLTKNNKTTATGGHIGWVSHITLQELHAKLGESEGFNGFSNRILWWCARREKLVPIPEPMPEVALQEIRGRLIGILGLIGKGCEVRLGAEAQGAWVTKYYADLTKDRPGLSGCVTNRGEAQALRLSMIYALLDGKTTISLDHLEAGIAVWAYCSQSARYIFHGRQADTVAQTILEALQKNPMTGTEIFRLFNNNTSKDRLEAALAELIAANQVVVEEQKQPKGRPTKLYRFREEPYELNELNELNTTEEEIEPIKFVTSFNSLIDGENTACEEDADAEYF